MTESTPQYESIQHDNALPDRIYTLTGTGFWQFRIIANRIEHPTIHGATFDLKLNVDGSAEITNISKSYRIVIQPI